MAAATNLRPPYFCFVFVFFIVFSAPTLSQYPLPIPIPDPVPANPNPVPANPNPNPNPNPVPANPNPIPVNPNPNPVPANPNPIPVKPNPNPVPVNPNPNPVPVNPNPNPVPVNPNPNPVPVNPNPNPNPNPIPVNPPPVPNPNPIPNPNPVPFPESDPLLQLKRSLVNSEIPLASWQPNSAPCGVAPAIPEWNGLKCQRGAVVTLRLEAMGLSGNIDVDALQKLRSLRSVSFANNSFAGPIPPFNRFGSLKLLYLSSNKFTGEIPPDFFDSLKMLRKLWLSGNLFTGEIPASISNLNKLVELHLENNQFSGPVPKLDQKSLTDMNLSNNKLEGEVPASMERFDPAVFAGNGGLCGGPLSKKCKTSRPPTNPPKKPPPLPPPKPKPPTLIPEAEDETKSGEMFISAIVILAAMVAAISIVLLARKMRRNRNNSSSPSDDAVEVHVSHVTSDSSRESSRKGSDGGIGGAAVAARRRRRAKEPMGDIVMVNDEKGSFGLPDLMKASAEMLGSGGVQSAYKAIMANGLTVVVKRMKDNNGKSSEDFDAEARRIGQLNNEHLLSLLAYYYRKDEKLFVYEYVPTGSLLALLHGEAQSVLNWPSRFKIIRGITQGLNYLHTELTESMLPHGDLKSSNVLIGEDFKPLLTEYGLFSLFSPNLAAQTLMAFKSPEALQYGKVSPKSDVFCLGIVILEILTRKSPSQYASNGKGGTDLVEWVGLVGSEGKLSELLDPQIASSTNSINDMENLIRIAVACIETNPDERLSVEEALRRIEAIQAR